MHRQDNLSVHFSAWLTDSVSREYLLHFSEAQWPDVTKLTLLLGLGYLDFRGMDSATVAANALHALRRSLLVRRPQEEPVAFEIVYDRDSGGEQKKNKQPGITKRALRTTGVPRKGLQSTRRPPIEKPLIPINKISIPADFPSPWCTYIVLRQFLLRFPEHTWPAVVKTLFLCGVVYIRFLGAELHLLSLDVLRSLVYYYGCSFPGDSRTRRIHRGKLRNLTTGIKDAATAVPTPPGPAIRMRRPQTLFPLQWITAEWVVRKSRRVPAARVPTTRDAWIYPVWWSREEPRNNTEAAHTQEFHHAVPLLAFQKAAAPEQEKKVPIPPAHLPQPCPKRPHPSVRSLPTKPCPQRPPDSKPRWKATKQPAVQQKPCRVATPHDKSSRIPRRGTTQVTLELPPPPPQPPRTQGVVAASVRVAGTSRIGTSARMELHAPHFGGEAGSRVTVAVEPPRRDAEIDVETGPYVGPREPEEVDVTPSLEERPPIEQAEASGQPEAAMPAAEEVLTTAEDEEHVPPVIDEDVEPVLVEEDAEEAWKRSLRRGSQPVPPRVVSGPSHKVPPPREVEAAVQPKAHPEAIFCNARTWRESEGRRLDAAAAPALPLHLMVHIDRQVSFLTSKKIRCVQFY